MLGFMMALYASRGSSPLAVPRPRWPRAHRDGPLHVLTVAVFAREHVRDEARQSHCLARSGNDVCAREASARVESTSEDSADARTAPARDRVMAEVHHRKPAHAASVMTSQGLHGPPARSAAP